MQRKDLNTVVVIVIVAGSISLVFSNLVLKPRVKREKVETVQAVSAEMPNVKNDKAYSSFYNSNALNPTQTIRIGDQQNQDPFRGGQ